MGIGSRNVKGRRPVQRRTVNLFFERRRLFFYGAVSSCAEAQGTAFAVRIFCGLEASADKKEKEGEAYDWKESSKS